MANHLRPLFITANFGGIPVAKVMVDGGAAINLLPHEMLSKMGERERFDSYTKKLKTAFFVVDTTSTTYNALLGEGPDSSNLCVPSTPHQQLAPWNEAGVHGDDRGRSTAISAISPCVLRQGIIMMTLALSLS
ncbi:unnamed protein product, partial [Prunus brigantina]